MRKILFFLLVLILFGFCTQNQIKNRSEDSGNYHYDIDLTIEPESNFIQVKGTLQFSVKEEDMDQIEFYLHRQLKIDTFEADRNISYVIDKSESDIRYIEEAMKVIMTPKEILNKGEKIIINFAYHGKITNWPSWSANVITSDWIEMGLYFPWFLYHPKWTPFTYRLQVDINPAYTVFAMGEMEEKNGQKVFKTRSPTNSIVVCASKDMKIKDTKLLNNSIRIAYYSLSKKTADALLGDLENIYKLYNEWFGRKDQDISLVESKREKGGGYVRIGGLFLSGFADTDYFEKRVGYHRYLGHELSHFWWYKADSNSWQDWLNESFAEYSALMVIRELIGKKEYDLRLEEYKEESQNTPSIWGVSRSHESAHEILYRKGPVLLSELEKKIGTGKYIEFCRKMVKNNISRTSDFLDLLSETNGREISSWFEKLLKTR
ncbi:hypothetical protein KGY73_07885 [bacterium]|nr:hypothetical protein [bacterium]